MSTAPRIEGIFTPHMVPLDERGQIDEAELRRYIDWLIERGVHGLYPNGSTGEFTRFTAEERRRIIQIVCDQVRGRVPILAGAAEANVRETIAACETYHDYGARAVAIVSPFYYKLSDESVYAYFREIALNSPIDVTLYNIPMFASPITVPVIRRLAEFERVAAIKDSSGDMAFMIRMIAAVRADRPDFVFLSGWEAALMPMLLMGCDGGTNATSGVVPELTRLLYDKVRGGDLDAARQLQFRLIDLFDHLVYTRRLPRGVPHRGRPARVHDGTRPPTAQRSAACGSCGAGAGDPLHPQRLRLRRRAGRGLPAVLRRRRHRAHRPDRRRRHPPAQAAGRAVSEAMGLIEVVGLTPAMAAVDAMTKAAEVRIVQAELNDLSGVVVKIAGPVAAVRAAIDAGVAIAGKMTDTVVSAVLPRVDERAASAIHSKNEFNPLIMQDVVYTPDAQAVAPVPSTQRSQAVAQASFALGLIETQGFTAVFEAIDSACKAANVEVVGKEKLGGGYITIVIKGDVAAVKAAVDAGKAKVDALGKLIAAHVIARPSDAVLALLPKS